MRSIDKVIEAIKKEVPDEYDDKYSFLKALDNVLDSANYRAPEAYHVNFTQLSYVLGDFLGDPDGTIWKQKIADIFSDKIKIDN